ncbi:DUF3445 domain-containing protein [uncultured Roseobacter sp.]|uniref:heme-dependent oxidative N-demethylase family protein n=1 Tax=uncultured Roseobacter sp. TaxID=114847 RepID=UPI00262F839B|nr:DUF3445 domain-containing protein [uncultured Roseobacter sp.]
MQVILQNALPPEMSAKERLPGVAPLAPTDWLRVDDAYAAQMAQRRARLAHQREDVLYNAASAQDAAGEVLHAALEILPGLGFRRDGDMVHCPDGHSLDLCSDTPLAVLGQIVQEDICILQKQGREHVLTAAVLCFPAGWTLAEKAGRPLTAIHRPVPSYDADIAARVQRLFDGVRAGRPLWRNNWLRYDDAELWQPHSESDPPRAPVNAATAPWIRAERQCILRLPQSQAVVFSIHTWVVAAQSAQS